MKTFDAILTIKARISNVCTDEDLTEGLRFEDLVKDLVASEGLTGIIDDDVTILKIEHEERDE